MPSTDRKLELNSKTSVAQTDSQPYVYAKGLIQLISFTLSLIAASDFKPLNYTVRLQLVAPDENRCMVMYGYGAIFFKSNTTTCPSWTLWSPLPVVAEV
jgi:hypothetical protein